MALITLSPLLSDIKGKIGGGVFQNSQGGLMLRTKVTPINRRTLPQNRSRIDMFNLQNEWLRLTQAQRDDWDLWAVTYPKPQIKNPLKTINGQQYFLKYNDYRSRYGLTTMQNVDWTIPTFSAIDVSFFNIANVFYVIADRKIDFANEFVVLFISWEVSPGLNNAGNRRKMIIFNTSTGNKFDLTTQVTNVFGAIPAAGSQIFYKVASFSRNTPYWSMFVEGKETLYSTLGIGNMIIGKTFIVS